MMQNLFRSFIIENLNKNPDLNFFRKDNIYINFSVKNLIINIGIVNKNLKIYKVQAKIFETIQKFNSDSRIETPNY